MTTESYEVPTTTDSTAAGLTQLGVISPQRAQRTQRKPWISLASFAVQPRNSETGGSNRRFRLRCVHVVRLERFPIACTPPRIRAFRRIRLKPRLPGANQSGIRSKVGTSATTFTNTYPTRAPWAGTRFSGRIQTKMSACDTLVFTTRPAEKRCERNSAGLIILEGWPGLG